MFFPALIFNVLSLASTYFLIGDDQTKNELQRYRDVRSAIPANVQELSTTPWGSRVAIDEALSEIRRLRENVENGLERVGSSETASSTGPSRMFAEWTRTSIDEKESLLEPANGTVTTTGPEGEILPHNGEIRRVEIDDSLPDRGGVGFSMFRTYRSHTDYAGPLGNGWDHNLNQRIVFDAASTDKANRADWYTGNRRVTFTKSGNDWEPEPGAFYRLTVTNETIFIESPLLQKSVFEPAASKSADKAFRRIREISSRHEGGRANVLRFRYAVNSDLLLEVTEPRGVKIGFAYDRHGLLTEIRRGSFVVRYHYDSDGNFSGTTIPNVARALDQAVDLSWKYCYETKSGRSVLSSVTPPGGPKRNYLYAGDSCRIVEINESAGDEAGSPSVRWTIDRKQEAENFSVSISSSSPLPKRVYTFSSDVAAGRLPVSLSIPARNATYSYRYNADELLAEEIAPLQSKRTWNYDTGNADSRFRGNLLEERITARPGDNPLAIVDFGATYEYLPHISLPTRETSFETGVDGKRRILREIRTEYTNDAEPSKIINGRQTTWVVRNRFGLPAAVADGLGVVTVYRYGDEKRSKNTGPNHGGLLTETISDVDVSQIPAMLRSSGISDVLPFPVRKASGDAIGQKNRFEYDQNNRVIREICDDGYRIEYVYNKIGLLLAQYDTRSDLDVTEYGAGMRKESRLSRVSPLKESPYQGESVRGLRGRFHREKFERDAFGRLAVWTPTTEFLAESGPPTVRYARYPSGDIRTRQTADGVITEQIYDAETGLLTELKV